MSSTFGSLNIGYSGLVAQKLGLDVTGQNIANASTDGYHRQSVPMSAQSGGTVPALYATSDGAGNGVTAGDPTRAQDAFLTARSLSQNATNSYLQGQTTTLTAVEDAIGEPSNTGLANSLGTFWNSFSALASNPNDLTARTNVLADASTVTDQMNGISTAVGALWSADQAQISTLATTTTTTAQQVAALNGQILAAQNGSGNPNALEDKRDGLVKQLAQQLGAVAQPRSDGTVDVTIGGQLLVSGTTSRTLGVTGASSPGSPLLANTVNLVFSDVNPPTSVTGVGGQVGAMLDAVNTTLPSYSGQLDAVANALTTQVNAQQAAGYDKNGVAGAPLFGGTSAGSISVVMTDPNTLAASASAPTAGVPSGDGNNALDMAALSRAPGSPDNLYSAFVVNLGVASASAKNAAATQQTLTTSADASLDASTGVDIDEETVNLVKYQTAYSASAKYISTIDQSLQDLLAMVG